MAQNKQFVVLVGEPPPQSHMLGVGNPPKTRHSFGVDTEECLPTADSFAERLKVAAALASLSCIDLSSSGADI